MKRITVGALSQRVQLEGVVGSKDCKAVVPDGEVQHLNSRLERDFDVQMRLSAFSQLQKVLASHHTANEGVKACLDEYGTESIVFLTG